MHSFKPTPSPFQIPMHHPMNSFFIPNKMPYPHSPARDFGGFLSKLFGKGSSPSPFQTFGTGAFPKRNLFGLGGMPNAGSGLFFPHGAAQFPNALQHLTTGSIPDMLNNVQKVLGIVQQVSPMIQQYGPFVKNLPGLLKIMKEINNQDSETQQPKTMKQKEEHTKKMEQKEIPNFNTLSAQANTTTYTAKVSKPKLYI